MRCSHWRRDFVSGTSTASASTATRRSIPARRAAIAGAPELDDLFPIFRAHPLLVQTFLSLGWRLGLHTGFERLVSVAAGVATVFLVYELGQAALRAPHRPGRRAAARGDAVPRRRLASGAARRADDDARHAHVAPAGALRPERAGRVAVRDRRGDGAHLPREGDEHRAAVRDLRVPGAHARAARAAARPRDLDGRDGARDRAVPAEPGPQRTLRHGRELSHLAAVPAAEPRLGLLRVERAGDDRPAGPRRGGRRPRDHAEARLVARAPPPVLDRRARPVLRAVAGEGVPVPPADRGAGGRARRASAGGEADAAGAGGGLREPARGERRACRVHRAAHRAGRRGRAARRPRGGRLDRLARARGGRTS